MKKTLIFFVFVICLLWFHGINASADEEREYIISEKDGEYLLSEYKNGAFLEQISGELSEIIAQIPSGVIIFDSVTASEDIELCEGSFVMSGVLKTSGDIIVPKGTSLSLSSLTLAFSDEGYMRIKGGSVSVSDSSVNGPIVLDYLASSALELESGEIIAEHRPAIEVLSGSASIRGGSVASSAGAAVVSNSELSIGNSPKLCGAIYDVVTSRPISLHSSDCAFSSDSTIRVQYMDSFSKGEMREAFYSASKEMKNAIVLFDKDGKEQPIEYFDSYEGAGEKNFIAVYLPHTVSYYAQNKLVYEEKRLSGECISAPDLDEIRGYSFSFWYESESEKTPYDITAQVTDDLALFASYKLIPPSFKISSYSGVYNKDEHVISFDLLSHPLDNSDGIYSFEWYKNGETVSVSPELRLRNVSDSGEYSCKITYHHSQSSVEIFADSISVTINKAKVKLPEISPKVYNGEAQSPQIYPSSLYSFDLPSEIHVGKYPIHLELFDKENYCFEGDGAVYFEIFKSPNAWVDNFSVSDVYFGAEINANAKSLFGSVSYFYSVSEGGGFSEAVPKAPGEYYAYAYVPGSDDYSELKSEIASFRIIAENPISISVISAPDEREYRAFEKYIPNGITAEIIYNSGRREILGAASLSFSYQQGSSFSWGDSGVIVSFGGVSCLLPVSVVRAEYDISSIEFSSSEIVYDAKYHTVSPMGEAVIGEDSIPLEMQVVGGGRDVGEYTVTLIFSTKSLQYNIPDSITAKLKITPHSAEITWQNTSFVYDGTQKIPSAVYLDVLGIPRTADVSGAKINAGERYLAKASTSDKNYTLKNAEVTFSISKADIDLSSVIWSTGSFVYDGTPKSVTLSGLPLGVSVVGYIDGEATEAGLYTATASLSFDSDNYNKPTPPSFSWEISKASYDMSGVSFEEATAVFDGCVHYPGLIGNMPVGKDGSSPAFAFSCGATHVSEGRVAVTVIFSSDSKNYLAPEPVVSYITVTPMPIEIEWKIGNYVYTGALQSPTASSSFTDIRIDGAEANAGKHIAVAIPLCSDYKIINPECPFFIEKAENKWTSTPIANDIFEGDEISIYAPLLSGSAELMFFADSKCTEAIERPNLPGIYYAVAYAPESENYLAITSEPLRMEIIAVVPVALEVIILCKNPIACTKLSPSDISAALINNDKSKTPIPSEDLEIIYENGAHLQRKDKTVTFRHSGFSAAIPISVSLAEYDLLSLKWENTLFVYDGLAKLPRLVGLPDGVSVVSYSMPAAISAGKYTVRAELAYDTENYIQPIVPECSFEIQKCRVNIPILSPIEYDGEDHTPKTSSPLYKFKTFGEFKNAGEYSISAVLYDGENFEFENGTSSVIVPFEIKKRSISLAILDYDLHLFEDIKEVSFAIVSGSVIAGEDLKLTHYTDGENIYLSSENPNYFLNVTAGKINRLPYPSPELSARLLIIFILFIAFLLLILIIYMERERIADTVAAVRCKHKIIRDRRRVARLEKVSSTSSREEKNDHDQSVIEAADLEKNPKNSEEETNAIDIVGNVFDSDIYDSDSLASEGDSDAESSEGEISEFPESTEFDFNEEEKCSTSLSAEICNIPIEEQISSSIDMKRADELITDSLAKDLLKKKREIVVTEGDGRGIINVDTLSESFEAGERVDVNILKKKSLIPYDTAYIKILARGMIDKPLSVYANDFSLSAVKMIALTGGEAVRVITVKDKKRAK